MTDAVVAVTGACGVLGRALLRRLCRDPAVSRCIALDLEPPDLPGEAVGFHRVDLTLPGVAGRLAEILAREGVRQLVHLAFLSDFTHRSSWAHELESIGTLHVIDACRQADVAHFVLYSQSVLYGAHPDNPALLTESHPLRATSGPGDTFFADKIDAETQARQLAEERPDVGVAVLRIAPLLGRGSGGFLSRMLRARFVPVLLGHDPLMQLTHPEDAARALHRAVRVGARGVFNIASDGVMPLRTLLALLGRVAVPVPAPLARRASSALWLGQIIDVPPSFLDFLRYSCVMDTDRARRELGFVPEYDVRTLVAAYLATPPELGWQGERRPAGAPRAAGSAAGGTDATRIGG